MMTASGTKILSSFKHKTESKKIKFVLTKCIRVIYRKKIHMDETVAIFQNYYLYKIEVVGN